jgi:uncharacterized protein YbjQ (UPF0145 family)
MGANFIRDIGAAITDIIGGRFEAYESKLRAAKNQALKEMGKEAGTIGAQAIIGVSFDYESMGAKGMLMCVAIGTAVRLEE